MMTYRLRHGDIVTSKDGDRPTTYANRTQAQRAASAIPGAEVIVRGRPFYVRLPEPLERENPRERGDDDGVEYADPRDAMDEL